MSGLRPLGQTAGLGLVAMLSLGSPSPAVPQAGPSPNPDALRARVEEARKLVERGAYDEAITALEPLLGSATGAPAAAPLAEMHLLLGEAYLRKADFPRALDHYSRAHGTSRGQGSPIDQGRALVGICAVHHSVGEDAVAMERCREAAVLLDTAGDRRRAAGAYRLLGAARDQTGDHRGALAAFDEAKARSDRHNEPRYFDLLAEIGITYKNLGEYEAALAQYAAALEGHRKNGDKYGEAMTLSNTGTAYVMLGQYERAAEVFQQALRLAQEIKDRRGQGFVLGSLANVMRLLGRHDAALESVQQQLEIAREGGMRIQQALALGGIAEVHLSRGALEEAGRAFEESLAVSRQTGTRKQTVDALVGLSEVRRRQGAAAAAGGAAEEAVGVAREMAAPEQEWQSLLALARARRSGGDAGSAREHLRAAAAVVNSVRGRVLTDLGKVGYLDARQAVFLELADLLQESGRTEEALEAAEAARSRAFSDLLAAQGAEVQPASRVPMAAIRDAEAHIRAQARSEPTAAGARAELLRRGADTTQAVSSGVESLTRADPELASLVVAAPVSFSDVVATARRLDATLVEYLVTDERLLIWVVSPSGEVSGAKVDVGREALRATVRELHERLAGLDEAALRDPHSLRGPLSRLQRWTVAPIQARLPRDAGALVYVLPHDVLNLVPFPALVDEAGRPLLDRHTTASGPSIGVLRYTPEKRRRSVSAGGPRLLALGDPQPPAGAALDRIPGTRREVVGIGQTFSPARRTILLGPEASEANAKRLAPGQTVIHYAAHGVVHDDRPFDSALVLSAGGGEDGWLRAREVFSLPLRADLVVLSGCSTGGGRLSGDGLLGLSRAFIYAGAPSVIVSQWDVSDVATAFLMQRFYDQLRRGREKAAALRQAQLATRARYPHPFLWAAFTLVGEPR